MYIQVFQATTFITSYDELFLLSIIFYMLKIGTAFCAISSAIVIIRKKTLTKERLSKLNKTIIILTALFAILILIVDARLAYLKGKKEKTFTSEIKNLNKIDSISKGSIIALKDTIKQLESKQKKNENTLERFKPRHLSQKQKQSFLKYFKNRGIYLDEPLYVTYLLNDLESEIYAKEISSMLTEAKLENTLIPGSFWFSPMGVLFAIRNANEVPTKAGIIVRAFLESKIIAQFSIDTTLSINTTNIVIGKNINLLP